MTFKSALLICALTFAFATVLAQSAMANPAGEPVNENDVTMSKSNDAIRKINGNGGKELSGANVQAAGIDCPDGSCYKTGVSVPGYQGDGTAPVIDVPADAKADPTSKDNKTKK